MIQVKAVLFDLDDTLYDHRHSSRIGLSALKKKFTFLKDISLDELEMLHIRLLNEIHISKVLTGEYTIDEARNERYRILFSRYGVSADKQLTERARLIYSEKYRSSMRAVPGTVELLKSLRKKVKVGIVSNNFGKEQRTKINACGLKGYFDTIITSFEAGFKKPSPEIFHLALHKLKCSADKSVMIGDSWNSDIIGAKSAGIRPIWFNRYGFECPEKNSKIPEIRSLTPFEKVEKLIFVG